MMSELAKLSQNCSARFTWLLLLLAVFGVSIQKDLRVPPVHKESTVSVLIRPVSNVSFDGADGPVGLQHPQGVIAGADGLLGDGASLILLGQPGV